VATTAHEHKPFIYLKFPLVNPEKCVYWTMPTTLSNYKAPPQANKKR